jgi:hypothetical protein
LAEPYTLDTELKRIAWFPLLDLMPSDATSHIGADRYPVPPDMRYSWL